MSIPTSFDPLGTLGGGYVTQNLVLWFDCRMEGDGGVTELTDWVTGTKYALESAGAIENGVLTSTNVLSGGFLRNRNYCVELVGCALNGRLTVSVTNESGGAVSNYPAICMDTINGVFGASRTSSMNFNLCTGANAPGRHIATATWLRRDEIPYLNGVRAVLTDAGAGMYGSTKYILSIGSHKFCALRVYSQPLTEAQIRHNNTLDTARYDKTKEL